MSTSSEATRAARVSGVYLRPAREAEIAVAVAIDDDACEAFAALDPRFDVDLPDDHPFVLSEIERWREAAARGRALFACTASGDPVGLVVLDRVGGRPYLEQVSVRRAWTARRPPRRAHRDEDCRGAQVCRVDRRRGYLG
jgi:hypothetical protein